MELNAVMSHRFDPICSERIEQLTVFIEAAPVSTFDPDAALALCRCTTGSGTLNASTGWLWRSCPTTASALRRNGRLSLSSTFLRPFTKRLKRKLPLLLAAAAAMFVVHLQEDWSFLLTSPRSPPGSILTLIPLRRSGLLSLSTWSTAPVGRPGSWCAGGGLTPATRACSQRFCFRAQLRVGEAVSVHHVRTEELSPRALPQLEARRDGGALHVRHSAENLWDLHRAGGLPSVRSDSK